MALGRRQREVSPGYAPDSSATIPRSLQPLGAAAVLGRLGRRWLASRAVSGQQVEVAGAGLRRSGGCHCRDRSTGPHGEVVNAPLTCGLSASQHELSPPGDRDRDDGRRLLVTPTRRRRERT